MALGYNDQYCNQIMKIRRCIGIRSPIMQKLIGSKSASFIAARVTKRQAFGRLRRLRNG